MLFWTCPAICTDTDPGPRRCQQRADLLLTSTDMGRTCATNILKKQNPFGKNQCLLLLPASRILSYPCWFSLHGYKLSHPVNTQPDMKISTHFVQLLTLPFTASASSTVIQTLWLGIPFWQVPTLILNKAGLASNQPTEGGFSFVSAM